MKCVHAATYQTFPTISGWCFKIRHTILTNLQKPAVSFRHTVVFNDHFLNFADIWS